jgi:hypothetical protein
LIGQFWLYFGLKCAKLEEEEEAMFQFYKTRHDEKERD